MIKTKWDDAASQNATTHSLLNKKTHQWHVLGMNSEIWIPLLQNLCRTSKNSIHMSIQYILQGINLP